MELTRASDGPGKDAHEPRVSVLLPVRNAASTLSACLRSLQRQTEARWQGVIVDDGSSDATPSILEEAARSDPRLEVIRTPARGLVAALRTGLEHCRAPLVARMDADDWMHRRRLEVQCRELDRRPECAALGAHVRSFPRGPELREGRRRYEAWLNGLGSHASIVQNAFVECPIAHSTLMIRTPILKALGYRERNWPEDYDLILRLLGEGHELAVVPQRLLGWRDHPERLSRTSEVYGLDRFVECKAAHLANGFLRGQDRYWLWGFGSSGRTLRKALLSFGHTPCHIIDLHPGRIGQTIHEALVIHPGEITSLKQRPLIVSVSGEKARQEIRVFLTSQAFIETRDYIFAA